MIIAAGATMNQVLRFVYHLGRRAAAAIWLLMGVGDSSCCCTRWQCPRKASSRWDEDEGRSKDGCRVLDVWAKTDSGHLASRVYGSLFMQLCSMAAALPCYCTSEMSAFCYGLMIR